MADQDKINRETIARLKKLPEVLDENKAILNRVGMAFRTLVKERAQQGKDIHDQPFQSYSEGYTGVRRRLRRPLHPVDLTIDDVSGMIAKVDHTINASMSTVTAYINDPVKSQIGKYHAVMGAGKSKVIREWWGLSNAQEERILRIINVDIDKILNKEL